jgi:hypothetical protein
MPPMHAQVSPVALRRYVAVGLLQMGADALAKKPWQSMNG